MNAKVTATRILVIDDELPLRNLMQRGLTLAGFVVVTADCGEAGLLSAGQNPPDVVLLDLMMPGLFDGFATLERLGQLPSAPKVIVMSGRDELEDRKRTSLAHGFLVKPVSFDFLIATIQSVIS